MRNCGLRPSGADLTSTKEVTWYGTETREDGNTARRLHILRECPKTLITSFSHDVIQLYMWSQQFNGALPEPGGLHDQNAIVMEALSLVHAERQKAEAWYLNESRIKQERDSARKNRQT